MDNAVQGMWDNRTMVSAEGGVSYSNPSGNCVEVTLMDDGNYWVGDTTDGSHTLTGDLTALRDTVRANG